MLRALRTRHVLGEPLLRGEPKSPTLGNEFTLESWTQLVSQEGTRDAHHVRLGKGGHRS